MVGMGDALSTRCGSPGSPRTVTRLTMHRCGNSPSMATGIHPEVPTRFVNDSVREEVDIRSIPDGWMGLDVGKQTAEDCSRIIEESKLILWNGPMGVFEMDNFQAGTVAVANAIVEATAKGAFSLIGGGDSVAAINKFNMADKVSYVSTGGGAMLEYLEGKVLPGINAIKE